MLKTKNKIVDLGEELIRRRGFNAFSYHDIATILGVKNAAIHYHFPSKESLGTDILRESQDKFQEMVNQLEREQANEWQKLTAFFEVYRNSLDQQKVCLVGALSPEYLTLGRSMQQALQKMVKKIFSWVAEVLKEGRAKGVFRFEVEPEVKAFMIITNMLGSLQLARVSSEMNFNAICSGILEELKP